MILEKLLDGPSDGSLLRGEALIKIDAVFVLKVKADKGGIRDDSAIIVDVGQFAFGSFANVRALRLIRQS